MNKMFMLGNNHLLILNRIQYQNAVSNNKYMQICLLIKYEDCLKSEGNSSSHLNDMC